MLETPILFLIFNRPKTTKQVFEKIRQVKPKYLYIAADGPRLSKTDERSLCEKTRAIIKNIDWDCEVKTLFREENLGCGRAVSSAISWFFEHVEEGIILEDDCIPKGNFFKFCEIMLEKYRNNHRVMQVSGTNHLFNKELLSESKIYYFSAFNTIWGWATWRRAWSLYEFEIKDVIGISNILEKRIPNSAFRNMLLEGFEHIANGNSIDTWDTQWLFCTQKNDGLCISPFLNMVENIGVYGAHTKNITAFHYLPTPYFDINKFEDPSNEGIDKETDEIAFSNILYPKTSLKIQVINTITYNINRINSLIGKFRIFFNRLRYFLPLQQRMNWFDLLILSRLNTNKKHDSVLTIIRLRKPTKRNVFIRKYNETDKNVLKYVFFNSYHKPPLILKKDCVILDLGANIGLTMVDFKQSYPQSRVLGFEMDTKNYLLAQKNIEGLADCWIENIAVWDSSKIVQYATDVDEDAYNISENAQHTEGVIFNTVEAWSMDDVLKKFDLKTVDYVKMDIEGAEKAVLQNGERAWLRQVNCLNIEIHDSDFLSEALQILESFGFECYKDKKHWSAIMAIRKSN